MGYNIIKFDLPFLITRGLKYGITEIQEIRANYYLLDLYEVIQRYLLPNRHVKQKTICSFLGLEIRDEIDGSEIPSLFEQKKFDKIKEHCKSDIKLTRELYKLLKPLAEHRLRMRYQIRFELK